MHSVKFLFDEVNREIWASRSPKRGQTAPTAQRRASGLDRPASAGVRSQHIDQPAASSPP